MLLSNAVFDGCTVIATVLVLRWAVSKRGMLRLPVAITVDVAHRRYLCLRVIVLCSCRSRERTQHSTGTGCSCRPIGKQVWLGAWPLFLGDAHDFHPNRCLLVYHLLLLVGEVRTDGRSLVFRKGSGAQEPTETSRPAACGVIVAIFGVGAVVAGAAQEYVKRKGTPAPMLHRLSNPQTSRFLRGGHGRRHKLVRWRAWHPPPQLSMASRKSSSNESRSV